LKFVTNQNNKYFFLKKKSFDFYDYLEKYKNISNLLNPSYNYYIYSFFIKKNFLKLNLKKNKSNNFNFLRNIFKNKKHSHLFLQNSINGGNKLKMLNYLNKMHSNFYYFFSRKLDFFQKKFPTYNLFFNFSKTDKKFFDLDFIFNLILRNNESIFYTKAVKLNKKLKQKNKVKTKYNLEVQYLKNDKRDFFTLKQIHLYSNNFNYYTYSERLLMSFFNVFFLEKNSDIYKNKIMTYQNILKKNSK